MQHLHMSKGGRGPPQRGPPPVKKDKWQESTVHVNLQKALNEVYSDIEQREAKLNEKERLLEINQVQENEKLQAHFKELTEKHEAEVKKLELQRKKLEDEWKWVQQTTGQKSRNCDSKKSDQLDSSGIIEINVGGTIFVTLLDTLTNRAPESPFANIFSTKFAQRKDSKGNLVIDSIRPDIFAYILEFLTYVTTTISSMTSDMVKYYQMFQSIYWQHWMPHLLVGFPLHGMCLHGVV